MKHFLPVILAAFIINEAAAQTPPATWQEHWFEHNQLVTRKFYDNDVAVYYDNDVSASVTWPYAFMGNVWRYTKSVYGSFGSDPHLFAIFHTNKYSGGHPSTYFDAGHDFRNVIDVGPYSWTSGTGGDLDLPTHEVAHIVELASKGIHGSPAFGIWGDSKWAEIYIYDVYLHLGLSGEATRWYNQMQNTTDNFPRANTHWFRDWFYPIYNNYGGNQVLNRFFQYLAQYFPKNGNDYSRGMNWGEFVHFWSGAAGADLKSLATAAFGWTTEWENQLNQAKASFPFSYGNAVTFYKHCDYGGYAVSLPAGSYTLSQLQSAGILNDDISSLQVQSGYQVTFYWDNNFQGSTLVKTGNDNCLVDDGWNDRVSSLVISTTGARMSQGAALTKTDGDPATTTIIDRFDTEDTNPVLSKLTIYPNPVSNELRLSTNLTLNGAVVKIIDVTGRIVLQQPLTGSIVNVSNLQTGIYTLLLYSDRKTVVRKFVK